jgi:CHAT domain-containing protein/tetratricopeptide (TPR) repeat protein
MRRALALSAVGLSLAVPPRTWAQAPDSPETLVERAAALAAKSAFSDVVLLLSPLAKRTDLAPPLRARLLERLAAAQVETGRFDESLAAIAEGLQIAVAQKDDRLAVRLLSTRGSAFRARGRPAEAIAAYEQARQEAERIGARDLAAEVLSHLSGAYQQQGDWARVLDYAERAYRAHPSPTDADRFRYLVLRGVAAYEFSDGPLAEASFADALALAERLDDRRGQSLAWGEIGLTAWQFGRDKPRALSAFERALALARAIEVPSLEADWLNNSGNVYRDSGELETALATYRRGLAVADRFALERTGLVLQKNTGQVLAALGRGREARPLLEHVIARADILRMQTMQWQARMELAGVVSAEDEARARELYEAALDIIEDRGASVLFESFRVGLLGSALGKYDPYERYIRLLAARGDVDAALTVAERARARVFLDTLALMRAHLGDDLPRDYLAREREILAATSAAQTALRAANVPVSKRQELVDLVGRHEEDLKALRLRLSLERPALSEARYAPRVALADVRSTLVDSDTVLAMYFLGRDGSWLWVIDRTGERIVPLPSRAVIEASVARFVEGLSAPGAPIDEAAGRALWATLVAPVLAGAPAARRLIVIPHGALHYLPFEALRGDDRRFLVQRVSVSYAPSLSSLRYLRAADARAVDTGVVVALGNPAVHAAEPAAERQSPLANIGRLRPLPYTGQELRRIGSLFGPSAVLLEGAQATERALAAVPVDETVILHVATHALVDESHPERSGLALSAQAPDDGILQLGEITRLKLRARLVTLSACETALGRQVTGEGLIGLTRAFFYAGANAVLASLWSVGDEATAGLMEGFYSSVRSGARLDDALAHAKRTFIEGGSERAHPYYWAAFVVSGNAAATVRVRSTLSPGWAVAAALALLAAALVVSRAARRTREAATR